MAIALDANLGSVTDNTTLTTAAAAAAGSRIIVFMGWIDSAAELTGFSGGGLSWVVDHTETSLTTGYDLAFISADAPSGLASSTNLTATFSPSPAFGPGFNAYSFTGLEDGASGYFDGVSTIDSTAADAWTTNNLTTTNADDLLLAMSFQTDRPNNAPVGAATELVQFTAEGTNFVAVEYRIVSATGTYSRGGTWSGGAAVFIQDNLLVAYKAPFVPPVPGPELQIVRPGIAWR